MKRKASWALALLLCLSFTLGAAALAGEEPITLTFWNIWGSGDANTEAVTNVIAAYQVEHPNVKIEVEYFENQAYKTTIKTNVAGDTAPDIYSAWGSGFIKPFVEAGKVLSLDSYLADGTLDKLNGGALDYFTFGEAVYGLPFGKAASGFFCNTRVFEENGVKIPDTWDELLSAIDAFNEKGITPIITSMKEAWVVGMLFEGLVVKEVGAETVSKTLLKEASFSDPLYLEAIRRFEELVDRGAFNADAAAVSRDEALASMKAGEGAMYYMGAWEASSFEADDSPDAGNYDWRPFPTIPGGAGAATEFNGGMIDGLLINANTKHAEAAVEFVKYFCENLSREGYQKGNYMPAWNTSQIDESTLPPVFAKINEYTNSATNYVIWWDTGLVGDDIVTYQTALNSFIAKQITAEQLVAELVKIAP
jgi:raffinose/stachyose/melibiose transport system substrate-binding protein